MTLNQLEYVIKAAEAGSINKAASQLFVSQSVLSTSIKNLEAELGRSLFIRTTKGIKPTAFGKAFISYITPIEHQLSLLDNFLYQRGQSTDQILSIVSNGFNFLNRMLITIRQRHPNEHIQISLHENSSIAVMEELTHSLADIGLACIYDFHMPAYTAQLRARHLEFHKLAELGLCAMVGPKNPLYTRREDWITPDMLSPYPAAMYGYMDAGPFSDIVKRIGLKSSDHIYSDSRAALYEVVSFSDAYYLNSDYRNCPVFSLYPDVEYLSRRGLLLKDCSVRNNLGWISRCGEGLNPLQQELVDLFYQLLTPCERTTPPASAG